MRQASEAPRADRAERTADRVASRGRSPRLRRGAVQRAAFALAAALITVAGSAVATDPPRWPQRAITLVAGNLPGSATDNVARLVAETLETQLGVSVVVENRAGAGGKIAAEVVAKATPNGYTLLVAGGSNLVMAAAMDPDLRYDPVQDFVPIGRYVQVPFGFAVNAQVPARTLSELAALARKDPGRLTYVSLGAATTMGFGMAKFLKETGTDMLGVEYKGSTSATPDVLAGRVDVLFTEIGALAQHASGGNLRVLAVTWPRRVARLPQVPTTAEQGFPGFVVASWYGLLAPAGTRPDVLRRLTEAYAAAMQSPTTRKRIDALGYEPVDDTPGRFATALSDEIAAVRETLKPVTASRR
jgi:tripartite-type tricarboxylate transporter receptor subunit TctC